MADLPRPGDDFGRYRIDGRLGAGGMGVVYAATDLVLGRRVALKVVPPPGCPPGVPPNASSAGATAFLERVAGEAALLARLDCRHAVTIYDYGVHGGFAFLVTQYVAGGDLGALLRARGPLPPEVAARVCAQVADALAETHRVGVVHCDVKPSNVLLRDADEASPTAYLCDFGIARADADRGGGSVSGTWAYLAPEVRRGEGGSAASDIYAVGCLLWAALFGAPPEQRAPGCRAHPGQPVPQVVARDAYSRRLNRLLARCLTPAPEGRYADAADLRADLERLAATPSRGVQERPETPRHARRPPRRRRGAAVAALALVLAVTGALVSQTLWRSGGRSGGRSVAEAAADPVDPVLAVPTVPAVQGDLDGDGFGDVQATLLGAGGRAAGAYFTATWRSTGKRFQAPVIATTPRRGGRPHILRADFDADSRPETLTCRARPAGLRCSGRLTAGGRFDQLLPVPAGRGASAAVAVVPFAGDVDGDGRADLVLLIRPRGARAPSAYAAPWPALLQVAVALNRGAPVAAPTPLRFTAVRRWATVPVPRGARAEVALGEVTGDARADLIYATSHDGAAPGHLEVLPSDGSAFRHSGPTCPLPGRGRQAGPLLIADVDGDGRPEIVDVISDRATAHVDVLTTGSTLGRPRSWGTVPLVPAADGQVAVTLSDVDGDGRADLVLAEHPSPRQLRIDVRPSEGDRFGPPAAWGHWPRRAPPGRPELLTSGWAP